MRLQDEMIEYLAEKVGKVLVEKKLIETDGTMDQLKDTIVGAINQNFEIEAEIDLEVKSILANHEKSLDADNINYRKMFSMIKKRIVKERGIVL